MLKIYIPPRELFNDNLNEFITINGTTLTLEHSLLSISKWESKWHKPFLVKEPKTNDEIMSYIECMVLNSAFDKTVLLGLTDKNFKQVKDYIEDSMTATTFSDIHSKPNREIVTSELIYYWMVALNIPFECQKWHINRLLTLIRICNIKNQPPKKMNVSQIRSRNRAINDARRKALHTKG